MLLLSTFLQHSCKYAMLKSGILSPAEYKPRARRDNSQGRVKVENQGLNSSQGWEEEKTKGGKKRKPGAE